MGFSLRDLSRHLSAITSAVTGRAVGIDIGRSAIKAVELRREGSAIILDSYGQIEMSRYETGSTTMGPEQVSNALLDLLHEVKIASRTVSVSVLSASTLVSIVDMPGRDEEQLTRLLPSEAQKYIPMKVEDVILDWVMVPDPAAAHNVFDTERAGSPVGTTRQEIMLAAIYKETIKTYQKILTGANLHLNFYEMETLSGARATLGSHKEAALMIDLGAITTKLSIVEQQGIIHVLHSVNIGGSDLTAALEKATGLDRQHAENIKRGHGVVQNSLDKENIPKVLTQLLQNIASEAQTLLKSYRERPKKDVSRAVLIGGGALLPGIEGYLKSILGMPVEIARPFGQVRGPLVLEGNLYDAGPIFANAVGLALRAIKAR